MYQVLGAWGQRGEEDASDLCFPDASTEAGEDTRKRTYECSGRPSMNVPGKYKGSFHRR